jgi:hypothetical protein
MLGLGIDPRFEAVGGQIAVRPAVPEDQRAALLLVPVMSVACARRRRKDAASRRGRCQSARDLAEVHVFSRR